MTDLQELRELMQFMRQFRQQGAASSAMPTLPIAPPTTPVPPQPTATPPAAPQLPETRRQVPETPIIHRYQTPRSAPVPLVAPASYQTFLGMSTLAPSAASLNTGHANQDRMLSANAVLPRGPSLVRRRPRGVARHPPSLVRRAQIDQCFVEGASVPTIRLLSIIYPPHDPEAPDQNFYVYRLLAPDFVDYLDANDLAYRYELPLTTPVNQLLETVVADMAASPSGYIFQAARRTNNAAVITTLQPLALISKGRVHNNQVRARVQPIVADMTIGNLAADRNRFAGDVCIADGRFIIRLAVMAFPLISIDDGGRRHTCIYNRIYSLFPRDADGMGPDLEDTSGGESSDDGEEVARQLWPARATAAPAVRTTGSSTTRVTRASASQALATREPLLAPTRPVTPFVLFDAMPLPASIWNENSTFVTYSAGTYSQDRFLNAIFQTATSELRDLPVLRVRGRDLDSAADHFTSLLDAAGRRGDYTDLLVPERAFALTVDSAVGEGLEREVMWMVLRRFLNQETVWFHRGAGDFLTLRTLFPASIPAPAQRLIEAKRLGAICGLLMVFGQSPTPISPAIFQYIVHGGNLHSLRPSFISEWFRDLRLFLLEFHEMGPEDDLTPLQSELIAFLDQQPSTFQTLLLFRPTLADTTFDHPELKSFAEGFLLPCRNGFDLGKAIRNFEGAIVPPMLSTYIGTLRDYTGDITLTFAMLVERFLRGTGTPSQFSSKLHEAPSTLSLIYRASTPLDSALKSLCRIFLGPVGTQDPMYAAPEHREMLAANGTFSFRTCIRTAMYPVQYVLRLAQGQYSPESEPADFQEAFDFWFLRQCLLGIGRHNTV
ncbi:hypothetical protein B0H13DRAFT_2666706 [Mycena leptocephala]|nr:hypothetical protein B0H13DRAFT_2666706 [Mycena leptocephala]